MKREGSADGAPRPSEYTFRRWLRVPEAAPLPAWVQARLSSVVAGVVQGHRGRALDEAVFGILDLETTGLSARNDRILEIGLVVQRAGRIIDRFTTLIDVAVPIPPAICALTGIDAERLVDAPTEREALTGLAHTLGVHRPAAIVAHNAHFDRGFLAAAWEEHPLGPPLPPFLCSLRLARRLVRAPRYGLDTLVRQLGIPPRERHRALGDAEMTARLWWELLLRAKLEGVHTLEGLVPLVNGTRRARPRRRTDRSTPAA